MKYITYILTAVFFILVFPWLIYAQQKTPPKIEWEKTLGGSKDDIGRSIHQTADGNYIVAGSSTSTDGDVSDSHGNVDFWVVKFSKVGKIIWEKSYGGTEVDNARSSQQTTDSGYIVGGYSYSINGDVSGHFGLERNADFWVVKLTANGHIEWDRALGGSKDDQCYSIRQTSDGGYIAAGYSASNDGLVSVNNGELDFWIVKLGNTGILEWEKSLGGSKAEYAYSVQETTDGGYIVAGTTHSNDGDVHGNHGDRDCWIVKLTRTGSIEWEKCLGGKLTDEANCIQETADGGYIVAGETESSSGDVFGSHGSYDCWIVKLTSTGVIDWQRSLGGIKNDYGYSIKQTVDKGYIIAGNSASTDWDVTGNHGGNDYWIVKLSSTGSIEWEKSLGGSHIDRAYSVEQVSDGGYIVAGESMSNNGDLSFGYGGKDYWIVKLSPEGTNSVESESATTRTATITPNPASTSATLTLDSDEAGACEVQIISVTGATLKEYSTRLAIGKQDIALSGLESLPSGMYEVLVKHGYQTLRTKFIVQ